MKKYFLTACLLLTLYGFANAQTARVSSKIDQNSIVKDESGVLLPYMVWQKMMQSGQYGIRKGEEGAEFQLYQLSDEQKAAMAQQRKNLASTMPKPRASDAFPEGDKFRGEKITDMNGNKYDLRKADGKVYVLNFWFINCPPCKKEIPELNEMVAKYKSNKDVVFLAIALDNYSDLKTFLQGFKFDYNVVEDGRYFSQKYGVKGYPTHVVVGKDGLIKFSTLGLGANTVYWVDKTIAAQFTGS